MDTQKPPLVLVSSNQKGGVGKTSLMFHTGGEFARRGQRVLVVDCDPQGSMSQVFFGSSAWELIRPEYTLAKLFDDVLYTMDTPIVHRTDFEHIHLLPAHQLLREFNSGKPSDTPHLQEALAAHLGPMATIDDSLRDIERHVEIEKREGRLSIAVLREQQAEYRVMLDSLQRIRAYFESLRQVLPA